MAKGQIAKDQVIAKIKGALGKDFIGEFNKKYYVWSEEDGERVQVCITLTCPKTFVGVDVSNDGMVDFSSEVSSNNTVVSAEITQAERDNLEALMNKLGL